MKNTAVQTISNLRKGTFGVEVILNTEPSMRKTDNPFVGRIRKISKYKNAVLGVSYENTVNGRLKKKGLEKDFVSDAPRGKKYYNPFFYVSDKDDSVFYLKIGMRKNTTCEYCYLVDSRPITTPELYQLDLYLTNTSYNSNKQAAHGLDKDEQYRIIAPKLENVVQIKISETTIK